MKYVFGLLAVALALQAEPVHVKLDPSHTTVAFALDATLHTVEGSFALKSGEILFDTATGEASGAIVIDALSGQSGNGSRDEHMHEAVLESERFSEVRFVPDRVEGALPSGGGASELKLHGQFVLHGQAHEMEIVAKLRQESGLLKVSSDFEVPYVAWGLKNPSKLFLRVAKVVEIHFEADAQIPSD